MSFSRCCQRDSSLTSSCAPGAHRAGKSSTVGSFRGCVRPGRQGEQTSVWGAADRKSRSTGACSTTSPQCITSTLVGHLAHHAQVVRDEQHAHVTRTLKVLQRDEDVPLNRASSAVVGSSRSTPSDRSSGPGR